MPDAADLEGILATLPPEAGGRRKPWLPGLRPSHEVRPGTYTSAEYTYPAGSVEPGATSQASLRFFFPEAVAGVTRSALEDLSLTDEPLLVRSALAVIAFGRGQPLRGRLLAELTDDEVEEVLKDGASE